MRILARDAAVWARRAVGGRDRPGAAGFGCGPGFYQRFPNAFRKIAVPNMIQRPRGGPLGEYGRRSRSR
jgi:hypothetical protein